MALILPDRVKVRSHSTGTGAFTLEAAVEGFRTFSVIGDGNETYYGIVDYAGRWEIGRGTWTSSSNSLSRDTVISSSNSNNKVNFPAGGKNVFVTFPSSLAQALFSSTASDSFNTISVAGQSNVNAESTTDTLTLEAGAGIEITTDPVTDTITFTSTGAVPAAITQGAYEVSIDTNGVVRYPGDITQSSQDNTTCPAGVDTVIYTATGQYQMAIKLFVMVQGLEDGGLGPWSTQACDIIAVKGFVDDIVHVTAYGVTYTGTTAFAEFDGQWNATTNRIEITCRPTSLTNSVVASVHAIEMNSND